ncbi:MAG: hypothetical protein HXS48_17325 [Theionarchaea archaeon]|nr:hypothetical protein [Theionarchaea archaeon]
MGKISQEKRTEGYCKVAGQLCENPFMHREKIAKNAKLSRNTVSEYLKSMYTKNILIGPWMSLNPHSDYKEYVYLMNFSDPFHAYKGLKGFPHVVYPGIALGDWNTIVITDRQLDFPQLVGFESVVYQGVKGNVYTPKIKYTAWDQSLKKIYEHIEKFTPGEPEPKKRLVPPLNWEEDQWKLYHAFKVNVRKKVTPLLRNIKVRYETYLQWMKTLQDHCTIHTEFYPQGCNTYLCHCYLLSSDYNQSIISLFSLFPTTPVIMEVGDRLLVFLKVVSSNVTRGMIYTIFDMKAVEMIKEFSSAVVVSKSRCVML